MGSAGKVAGRLRGPAPSARPAATGLLATHDSYENSGYLMADILRSLGLFAARRRRLILIAAAMLFAVATVAGIGAFQKLQSGGRPHADVRHHRGWVAL
jgi:hypothetical protein